MGSGTRWAAEAERGFCKRWHLVQASCLLITRKAELTHKRWESLKAQYDKKDKSLVSVSQVPRPSELGNLTRSRSASTREIICLIDLRHHLCDTLVVLR